ncbi:Scp-like extracellular protein, partial [Globisporangium splendens]
MVTSPLALIQPPSGTWLKGSGGRSAFAYNCDLPFNDIRNFPLANADACGSSCADEPKCSHWTWRNGNCMLKFGTEHQAIASQGTTCGFIFGRFNQMTPDMLVPTMVTSPLALIQPPSGTWLKGSGGRSAFAYNCDLPFNDIRNFPLANADACGSSCADEPKCSHWTWRNGNCMLKFGTEHQAIASQGTTCGFIFGRFNQSVMGMPMMSLPLASNPMALMQWVEASGGRAMLAHGCDYPGRDYVNVPSSTELCGDLCANDQKCTHWMWHDGQCFLKAGGDSTLMPLQGATCGFVIGRFNEPSSKLMTPSVPSMASATVQPNYDDVFHSMAFEPEMGTRVPVLANGMTSTEVEDMLTFINALRLSNKLQPVVLNDALVLAATEHSKDQANRCVLAHLGSDGSTPELRVSRHGYNGKMVWEHISVGKQTMTEILDPLWRGLTSHYDDILQAEATEVGFARAINIKCNDYRSYWTLVFSVLQ